MTHTRETLVNNAITIVVRHANFTFLSLYSIYTSLNIKILFPLTACLWQSTYVFNLRWLIKNNFLKKYGLGKIVTQLLMVLMYVVSRKGKIGNWTLKIYSFNIIEMGSVKIRMQSWFQHHVILHNLISFMWMFSRSLSFCTFSFGHCVVCSSSIYAFWLPYWYLQTLLNMTV